MEKNFQTLYDNNLKFVFEHLNVDTAHDTNDFIQHLLFIAEFCGVTIVRNEKAEQWLKEFVAGEM